MFVVDEPLDPTGEQRHKRILELMEPDDLRPWKDLAGNALGRIARKDSDATVLAVELVGLRYARRPLIGAEADEMRGGQHDDDKCKSEQFLHLNSSLTDIIPRIRPAR